ncbi:transporter hol1 [Fusarium denticulatum]|uniref:Transporter hol1 n=1 Tax=Fusarium denticulatum TaxID=48507 RepID=A0A8H5XG54_9HYPO|nr:transporter hol1 [Fusarium denticulatum]
MTFRSMSYGLLLNEEAAVDTQAELELECFNMCQKKNGCRHTLVEGAVSPEASCVRPVTLRAWLNEDVVKGEAVTSTADGASYDDSISVDSALDKDHDRDHDDDGYDERALDLLQSVMTGMANRSDIPDRIELDVLVGYIKVVDKQKLRELYLPQGFVWYDVLLPNMSTSFDEDAIAWLWILWRLHMPTEFRKLSAIVAQQAIGRIGPEHDRHGVNIPESIIDAIEERRVHALTQVKDGVDQVIEFCRNYKDPVEQNWFIWGRKSPKINSILISRYLRNETWDHFGWDFSSSFRGLSFEKTAKWIRSMMNSGDWMIRTVPPVTVPQLLAFLSSSVLGVDLHGAGDSAVLSSHVHKELTNLVARLEAQDWGIELDRVTCRPSD